MLSGVRGRGRVGLALSIGFALAGVGFGGCTRLASEDVGHSEAPIVGGKLDTTHKAVVSLLKQVQGGYYPACSGTLLARNLVLTAHHCVAGLSSDDGQSVECGQTEFGQTTRASSLLISVEANVGQEGLDPYRVAEVWLPPQAGSGVCGKDIALLLLSGSGVPANVAAPIEPRLANEIGANEEFAAIGFGLQDPDDEVGETAGHRMSVTGASVFCTGAACGTDIVAQGEWIADSPVCSGDSGGPALDENGRVAGVTSRGDAECTVGIYTSVYAWRDFIKDGAFDAAERGHYTPPTWAGEPPAGFDAGLPSGGSGGTNGSGGSDPNSTAGAPTLAGTGSVVGGNGSGTGSPTIDPLGIACTDRCPGSYACWTASTEPPGICVPLCGPSLKECPAGYECSMNVGACVPTGTIHRETKQTTGSCQVVAAGGAPTSAALWVGLAALCLTSRRRLPKSRPRPSGT